MSKAKTLSIAATILFAAVVAGHFLFLEKQPKERKAPSEKLTIGSPRQEASSLMYLAKENRYFAESGLTVDIKAYHFGFGAIQGALSGEVDIAFATDFALVASSLETGAARVLCSIAEADVEELIARKDNGILEIEDLKGKTIGVRQNSSAEFHLATFLLFNELSMEDVRTVDLPPPDLEEAVLSNTIDATVIWPPHAFRLKKEMGGNAVSWSVQSGQVFFWLAVTTERVLAEKQSAVNKFVAALLQAEAFVKANDAQAKSTVQNYLGLDAAYMDYHWPKQKFMIELPQSLLIKLEDEARWKIKKQYTGEKEVPNYLDFIVLDPLNKMKPRSVTIIQ